MYQDEFRNYNNFLNKISTFSRPTVNFLSFLQGNEFRSRHPPFAFFMQSEIIPTIVACCFSVCPTAQDVKKEY